MKSLSLLIVLVIAVLANPAFAERNQTHRLGMKAGLYSPTGTKANLTGLEGELQFDAVIHEQVDAGPRIGVFLKTVDNRVSPTENSKFLVIPLTFQFRFYPIPSDQPGNTHGVMAPYVAGSAGYYLALLYQSNSLDNQVSMVPEGIGGIGGTLALGCELGIGRNTAYFVELAYRRTGEIKSMRGYSMDLDGYTFCIGARF